MLRSMIGAAVAALSTFAALAAPVYKIEAIPKTEKFVPMYPEAINNSGVVVGRGETAGGKTVAFKYSKGKVTRLPGDEGVTPVDINRGGDILGQGGEFNVIWRADGTREELGVTGLVAMNRLGQATGVYAFDGELYHASFYDAGVFTDLGAWGGGQRTSYGAGINDLGQVVGTTTFFGGEERVAVIWESGTSRQVVGLPNEINTDGIAINAKGHIVGMSSNGTSVNGFFNDGIKSTKLARVGSQPFSPRALNIHDEVVGWFGPASGSGDVALWKNGQSYKLMALLDGSSAGWTELFWAFDINDSGQIVGVGTYNGEDRAFIATRVTQGE
jgi:probable HAF family extracellular repeat protein